MSIAPAQAATGFHLSSGTVYWDSINPHDGLSETNSITDGGAELCCDNEKDER